MPDGRFTNVESNQALAGPLSSGASGALDAADLGALAELAGPVLRLKKGAVIGPPVDGRRTLDLLLDGWAVNTISLSEGDRQIVGIHLPGDIVGLGRLASDDPIDEVVAVSEVAVRSVPLHALDALFTDNPRLAALLFLVSVEERALAMERLALMGHMMAKERLAAHLVRLGERVSKSDPSLRLRFEMPLTQQDLADMIGVSTVHLNGIVQELRAGGLIRLTRRELHILDHDALVALAGIRPWKRARADWLPASVTAPAPIPQN